MPKTTSESDQPFALQPYEVQQAMRNINTKKAPGPDMVTGTERVCEQAGLSVHNHFQPINKTSHSPHVP